MTSPAPVDPQQDDDAAARRQAIAQRRARQRRTKIIQAILLIAVAVVVIVIGSDAQPSGTSTPLSPEESRALTLGMLLALGTLALGILLAITVAQWTWRPRFVLLRGGLLGIVWIVVGLLWLSGPAGQPLLLIGEVLLVIAGAIVGVVLARRQRRTNQQELTPEAMDQALARQQAIIARNEGLSPAAVAGAYYNRALLEKQASRLEEARRDLDEALIRYEELGNPLMQAHCLNVLGQVVGHEQPRRAPAYFERALALLRQEVKGRFSWPQVLGLTSNATYEVMFLNNAADAQLNLDQATQALSLLEEAMALYRRTQEPRGILSTLLINQVRAHARLGHADQARALAESARAVLKTDTDLRPAQRAFLELRLDEVLASVASEAGPNALPADFGLASERPAG